MTLQNSASRTYPATEAVRTEQSPAPHDPLQAAATQIRCVAVSHTDRSAVERACESNGSGGGPFAETVAATPGPALGVESTCSPLDEILRASQMEQRCEMENQQLQQWQDAQRGESLQLTPDVPVGKALREIDVLRTNMMVRQSCDPALASQVAALARQDVQRHGGVMGQRIVYPIGHILYVPESPLQREADQASSLRPVENPQAWLNKDYGQTGSQHLILKLKMLS
jgi:hypothetical protein